MELKKLVYIYIFMVMIGANFCDIHCAGMFDFDLDFVLEDEAESNTLGDIVNFIKDIQQEDQVVPEVDDLTVNSSLGIALVPNNDY